MARPPVTDTTEEVYEALGPWARADDEPTQWALLHFVEAVARPLDDLNALVRDTDAGPGWSPVVDVDRAPGTFLPWLAQFVGVTVPAGFTAEQARVRIAEAAGWHRGSPSAIRGAARQFLSGTGRVELTERDGHPYRLRIAVYDAELDATEARVEAAVRAEKPAGLILTFDVLPGMTWGDADTQYATWGDMADAHATWGDVASSVPTYPQE